MPEDIVIRAAKPDEYTEVGRFMVEVTF